MAKKLKTVTKNGTRLDQLKTLAQMLADRLDNCEQKDTAQLAKQYRETILEIEEIEDRNDTDDELSEILQSRESDGKPAANRKDSTRLS